MYRKSIDYLHVVLFVAIGFVFIFAGVARGQQSGGDLGGGAGIFRPKNPKRSAARPMPLSRVRGLRVQPISP